MPAFVIPAGAVVFAASVTIGRGGDKAGGAEAFSLRTCPAYEENNGVIVAGKRIDDARREPGFDKLPADAPCAQPAGFSRPAKGALQAPVPSHG